MDFQENTTSNGMHNVSPETAPNRSAREKKAFGLTAIILSGVLLVLTVVTLLVAYLAHVNLLWLAIVTLVLALATVAFGVVGLVLNRKRKKALSLTGLIVSSVMALISIITLIVICVVPAKADSNSETTSESSYSYNDDDYSDDDDDYSYRSSSKYSYDNSSSSSSSNKKATQRVGNDEVGFVTIEEGWAEKSEEGSYMYTNGVYTVVMGSRSLGGVAGNTVAQSVRDLMESSFSDDGYTDIEKNTTTFTDKGTGQTATAHEMKAKKGALTSYIRAIYVEGSDRVYLVGLEGASTSAYDTYKKTIDDTWSTKR